MKTSKIIFTSYFSLIGILLIALMISGFINNDKGRVRASDFITDTYELSLFKHIKVDPNCWVTIKNGTSNHIEIARIKKDSCILPKYTIIGDTLTIQYVDFKKHTNIQIFTTNTKSISVVNSHISIKGFKQDSLQINARKGDLIIKNKVYISNLNLNLINKTKFNSWDCKFESIAIKSNDSRFYLNTNNQLKLFKGEISNKSDIQVPKSLKYDINTDESSQLRMY